MTNITASFILAALVIYLIARGYVGRLLDIVGLTPTNAVVKPSVAGAASGKVQ